jgi:hypothetical protein
MKANVFHGPNNIHIEEVPRPHPDAGEAVISDYTNDNLRDRPSHSAR